MAVNRTSPPKFRGLYPPKSCPRRRGANLRNRGSTAGFYNLDNDGDQDLYAVMGGAAEGDTDQNLLFENPGNDKDCVTLVLESNKRGIGAKVAIETKLAHGSSRTFYHTVSTGGRFGGSSVQAAAGLGKIESSTSVRVLWPEANLNNESSAGGVSKNGVYLLSEGTGSAQQIERKGFKFGPAI